MGPNRNAEYLSPMPVVPTVTVPVVSPWWSKINWTQVVGGLLAMAITLVSGRSLGFDDATTVKVLGGLNLIQGVVTVIFKVWFTSTVTPQSL